MGPGLLLAAGRERRAPQAGEVYLRRGRAFPVGHPTTRLCLDLLRDLLSSRCPETLLEVGCGCGVLCLAAAALGVGRVIGVDLDPQACLETRENAAANRLDANIKVIQGSTECLRDPFALVVANLPLEVQVAKAAELQRLTAPGGILVLSGFREPEEAVLRQLYPAAVWRRHRRLSHPFHHPELPPQFNFTWVAWELHHLRSNRRNLFKFETIPN